MSLGAVVVLRARKPNSSREKRYPDDAVMLKRMAFPAAAWVVGTEKKPAAPLICAALFHPVLDVKARKAESLSSMEIVIPVIGEAELAREPPAKLKFARVAQCEAENPEMKARISDPSVRLNMAETGGGLGNDGKKYGWLIFVNAIYVRYLDNSCWFCDEPCAGDGRLNRQGIQSRGEI